MTSHLDPEDAQQIIDYGIVYSSLRMSAVHADGDMRVKINALRDKALDEFRESVTQHVTEQP